MAGTRKPHPRRPKVRKAVSKILAALDRCIDAAEEARKARRELMRVARQEAPRDA